MKKGDKVLVYFDPLTENHLEGKATLMEYRYFSGWHNGKEMFCWQVRFPDGREGPRTILKAPEPATPTNATQA